MNNQILLNDNFGCNDNMGLRGEVIFGTGKRIVKFIDPFGNPSFKTVFDKILYRDHNIVTIGGYQFVFNKLFNIAPDEESTLRVGDLNDEAPLMKIGVPRSKYISSKFNAETHVGDGDSVTPNGGINISANNFIFGFMVGDGGSREDNITPIAPDYKNRMLYHAIPFRMSNDGYDFPNGKYFGKSSSFITDSSAVTSYYIKKFDNPAPHIVHSWVSNTDKEAEVVDDSVFASTSSNAIESYVEMNLSLSEYDTRGYFASANTSARVNEFALVSGWYNYEENDYEHLQLITKFTRSSVALEAGDTIEAVYRLYAR